MFIFEKVFADTNIRKFLSIKINFISTIFRRRHLQKYQKCYVTNSKIRGCTKIHLFLMMPFIGLNGAHIFVMSKDATVAK